MRLEITALAEHDLSRIFAFDLRYDGRRRLSVPDVGYVIDYRVDADAVRVMRFQSMREVRDLM